MILKDNSLKVVPRPVLDVGLRLKKPTAAIVMKPVFGKLTASGRKLLNVLMFLAQKQIVESNKVHSETAQEEHGLTSFTSKLSEILDLTTPEGMKKDGRYSSLQQNIINLQMVRLEWSSPDVNGSTAKDKLIWVTTVLLASARIYIEDGVQKLRWSFSYEIGKSLSDPERFTSIYMRELSLLNTYCAISLYEICSRYRDNPTLTTSTQTPGWWIEALSGDSKIDSIKQINSKIEVELVPWKYFKRDYLKNAIELINTYTSLQIKVSEICSGRIISGVKFEVTKKTIDSANMLPAKRSRSSEEIKVLNRAAGIGLSELVAGKFIDDYGIEYFITALNKYESRSFGLGLSDIKNKASYMRSILNDIAPKKVEVPAIENKSASSLPDFSNTVKVENQIVSTFDKYRTICTSLSEVDRLRYKTMLGNVFREKNMFSAGIKVALDKPNFGGGICLSEFKKMIDAGL